MLVISPCCINLFKDLHEKGVFLDGNTFHIECLRFCFAASIQLHWSTHHVRPSPHDATPGKPDELFFFQEHSGCVLIPILQAQVDDDVSQCDSANAAEENDYQEYFKYVCVLQNIGMKILINPIIL